VTVIDQSTVLREPWTPKEDAVLERCIAEAKGIVLHGAMAAATLLSDRTVNSCRKRADKIKERGHVYLPPRSRDNGKALQAARWLPAPVLPTLAELMAEHPRCPDCGGRWRVERDPEGGGQTICQVCATDRWWR
jgi:hypothetical protein